MNTNTFRGRRKLPLLTLMACAACYAGTITTLYNTGQGLPVQSVDPRWQVNGQTAYVTNDNGLPFGPGAWMPNGVASVISPQPDYTQGQSDDPGPYYYTTQFDLTGFDLSTIQITVHAASDNFLVWLKLNGDLAHSFTPPVTDYTDTPEFTLVSGFTSGLNSLEFKTINLGPPHGTNPSGFRASFDTFADIQLGVPPPPPGDGGDGSEAPEPGSVLLIGGGMLAVSLLKRGRNVARQVD